jgi:hypothetical protein
MDGVVTVVETYSEEPDAIRDMHKLALRLKNSGRAKQYGVFTEKRAGVFYLCLVHRESK